MAGIINDFLQKRRKFDKSIDIMSRHIKNPQSPRLAEIAEEVRTCCLNWLLSPGNKNTRSDTQLIQGLGKVPIEAIVRWFSENSSKGKKFTIRNVILGFESLL